VGRPSTRSLRARCGSLSYSLPQLDAGVVDHPAATLGAAGVSASHMQAIRTRGEEQRSQAVRSDARASIASGFVAGSAGFASAAHLAKRSARGLAGESKTPPREVTPSGIGPEFSGFGMIRRDADLCA